MNNSRVAVISIDYPPKIGGGPTRAAMITQALERKSFDVTVFAGGNNGFSANEKGNVYTISALPPDGNAFFRRLMRYLFFSLLLFFVLPKKKRFDFIIVCGPHPFIDFAVLMYCKFFGTTSILDLSDLWPEAIHFPHFDHQVKVIGLKVNNLAFKKYNRCVYMNESIKAFAENNYGLSGKSSVIVRNITDTSLFMPSKTNSVEYTILYHGTAGPYQGLMQIINIAYELKSRGDIKFIIRANGVDVKTVVAASKNLCLKNVVFIDPMNTDELRQLVSKSTLGLIVASNLSDLYVYCLLPTKLSEFLASGVPVVAPNGSAAARIVLHYNAGITVDFSRPVFAAKEIVTFLTSNKLDEYRLNARNLALHEFSLDTAISSLDRLFEC